MRPNFHAIEAIAYGFRFVITGLPTALRLGWLPFLIVTAATIQTTSAFVVAGFDPVETMKGGFGALMDHNTEWSWEAEAEYDFPAVLGLWGLMLLLGNVLFIPSIVGLYRQAANVDVREGFLPVFGGPEWRFFASFLIMPLVFLVVMLGFGLLVAVGAFVGEATGMGFITVISALLFALAIVWFLIRFSLFQVHVAVTNTLSVPAAFGMTGGRFWKLLGTYLLVGIIFGLLGLASVVVFGTGTVFFDYGSAGFTGFAVLNSVVQIVINIIGFGIVGRIVGDLLETTEYGDDDNEPFDDEPEDDDLLDELIDDEADYAAETQAEEPIHQASYGEEPQNDGMMRRFGDEQQQLADVPPGNAPIERRSSMKFLRNRFR